MGWMMRRLTRLMPLATGLVLAISVPVTAVGFQTPEEAVREYVEAVASADTGRLLEASAVDEMTAGYRFDQQVERIRAFSPAMAGPVHSPFFGDVQRADWTGQLLRQTKPNTAQTEVLGLSNHNLFTDLDFGTDTHVATGKRSSF